MIPLIQHEVVEKKKWMSEEEYYCASSCFIFESICSNGMFFPTISPVLSNRNVVGRCVTLYLRNASAFCSSFPLTDIQGNACTDSSHKS